MSSTLEVHNIQSNSFERARSVSKSRGQTAEEKAFEEMKKMLSSYQTLTEKLMLENASLQGRVSAIELSLEQERTMYKEALEASKAEISALKQEVKFSNEQLQGKLEKTESKLAKLHQGCLSLDQRFVVHGHPDHSGQMTYHCNWTGLTLASTTIPQNLDV